MKYSKKLNDLIEQKKDIEQKIETLSKNILEHARRLTSGKTYSSISIDTGFSPSNIRDYITGYKILSNKWGINFCKKLENLQKEKKSIDK